MSDPSFSYLGNGSEFWEKMKFVFNKFEGISGDKFWAPGRLGGGVARVVNFKISNRNVDLMIHC